MQHSPLKTRAQWLIKSIMREGMGGERGERAREGDMKGGKQRLITASRGARIKDLHWTDEFAQ